MSNEFQEFLRELLQEQNLPQGRIFMTIPVPDRATIEQFVNALNGSQDDFSQAASAPTIPDDHPNYKHCPELYSSYPGRTLLGNIQRKSIRHLPEFPGVQLITPDDWAIFDNSYTFYPVLSAPSELDDLYGVDYVVREKIYGFCKPTEPDSLLFYSSEELLETFLQYQNFVDPKNTKKRFNKIQIDRFVYLLSTSLRNTPLLETIQNLSEIHHNIEFQSQCLSKHPQFRSCLDLTLKVGMYMRGWDGVGAYPLDSLSTNRQVNEKRLLEALWELKGKLDNDWSDLASLRLYRYLDNELLPDESCPTLSDRLSLVLRANRPDSCIRVSSNILCTTAWHYCNKFYQEKPFQLSALREIY